MAKAKKYYWVYILNCNNGNYYTGYTTDIDRRFKEHMKGTSKSKYTRSFKPLNIAQYWRVKSRGLAMRLEYHIKTLSKKDKQQLLLTPRQLRKIIDCEPML